MKKAVIVSAVRTPIGRFNGALKDVPAPELGSIVVAEAVDRIGLNKGYVQEVLMGNVVSASLGQNPARQAAIYAGIPVHAGATTLNKVCGSGLKTIMMASNSIRAGEYEIIVAGGMENMSRCPYLLENVRSVNKMGNVKLADIAEKLDDAELIDAMIHDGLWEKYNNYHMGLTGERIAERYGITREELDKFSLNSHKKACKAIEEGKFKEEIIPLQIDPTIYEANKGPIKDTIFDTDEGPRKDATLEKLASLKPVFKKDGIITAGNASQISDGASAVVVMSYKKARELKIKPLAKIVDYHTSGVRPADVMEAPIPTVKELLKKVNVKPKDIDLWEHNEAFSSASIAVQKEFKIPDKKFNVNGGAVALGHPIGCSGARVLTTLIYAMKDKKAKRGLATLCLGGGNAVAMIIER